MIPFSGKAIVLDIEGTTSSISFVHDVLFPYAREEASAFLQRKWADAEVRRTFEQMALDIGLRNLDDWLCAASDEKNREFVLSAIYRWMDQDAKTTGLKSLQGLIWDEGYHSGLLRSHVFEDVPLALASWRRSGIRLAVYSSGSIAAQKAFFAHTEYGDLAPFFSAHFDTTTGPKKEADSYRQIALELKLPPESIAFVSDIVAELNAAKQAEMQTILSIRPGNAPATTPHSHPAIRDFREILIEPLK